MDRVSSDDSSRNTKSRLLDAAEQLYTRSGPDSLSLRDLTEHAGVNLAAVNYHFGSKNALVCAMVARRLDGVNESRLAELTRLESTLGERLRAEHLLAILVKSLIQDSFDIAEVPEHREFMIRVSMDLSQPLRQFLTQRYSHVETRFLSTLTRLTPWLDAETLRWRMQALAFALPGVGLNANTLLMIRKSLTEANASKEATLQKLIETMRTLLQPVGAGAHDATDSDTLGVVYAQTRTASHALAAA